MTRRGTSLDPVVVWGAGAMGGCIGAALTRAGHEVVLVDSNKEHGRAIRQNGLRITGPVEEYTVRPYCAEPDWLDPGLGTVLLCVKAHHTRPAMRRIEHLLADDGFVVSVQNGLNEMVISQIVGQHRTVGCFVNFGADVIEPGVVMRGNRGAVVVGEINGQVTPRIEAVHALFKDFEPETVLTDNIWGYLWGKLAYGSMLFATALTDASIAEVFESKRHRPVLIEIAREVMRVALARGVRPVGFDGFDPAAFAPRALLPESERSLDRLIEFNRGSAKTHSGVWRDIAVHKRRTEVDDQIAPIARLGGEVGVATPLIDELVHLIHDLEAGARAQSWQTLDELVRRGFRPRPDP